MHARIIEFWKKYEHKIILAAGFVLVAIISFEGGVLKGAHFGQSPLIIQSAPQNQIVAGEATSKIVSGASNLPQAAPSDPTSLTTPAANCAFVGSKNSNMYHLATSSYAKRINPENRVCFSSTDEAKSKGYLPDKSLSK
ncbi:MAG: hypothetical protein P4L62_00365 [Candidatus Pacebacteria bacterium]|nr:hypothetical protein [Candidatus Paceibacterota bacterium]MDR3582803.1 hypothetical protein [Candidatus Paceibacterota bacterium]